ncbi:mariner transposase [Trichonephila clavipes]|nr:mariner transposase [Trichonephila clavipes]
MGYAGSNSLGGRPLNQIINAAFYCLQLDRLYSSLVAKWPGFINRFGVILHHDNARPDAVVMTGQKLMGVGLEVFPQPPFSLDLAPTDYPLFRALNNSFNQKSLMILMMGKLPLKTFLIRNCRNFTPRGLISYPKDSEMS